MITPDLWLRISEAARLRIESKLLREVLAGEIHLGGKVTNSLGTWANTFMKNFALRAEAAKVLIMKLEDRDPDDRHYVARFYMSRLPEILTEESEMRLAVRAIAEAIREEDVNIREAIITNVRQFPATWQKEVAEALEDVTNPENPAVVLDDGTPLLEAPTVTEITDDDIPF
jgi:dihydroxyacetone kinase DhaKLM complex PTS-EIIA-like component DhaM